MVGDVAGVDLDRVVAEGVEGGGEVIERCGGVVGGPGGGAGPERGAVVGREVTGHVLFLALIHWGKGCLLVGEVGWEAQMCGGELTGRDSIGEDGEGNGVLGQSQVIDQGGEPREIMVLGEDAHNGSIGATVFDVGDHFGQDLHVAVGECLDQREVDGEVGHGCYQVLGLISAHILHDAAVDLAKGEDTGGLDEGGEIGVVDVFGGVNTEAINGIIGDEACDPGPNHIRHFLRFRRQIGECDVGDTEPALLSNVVVVVVCDVAVWVVIFLVVEGKEAGIIDFRAGHGALNRLGHIIDHHVNHQIHASVVNRLSKTAQIIRRPEILVDGVEIFYPVPMIGLAVSGVFLDVLHHGRDLDGCETHALNIIEVVDQARPGTSAVIIDIVAHGG